MTQAQEFCASLVQEVKLAIQTAPPPLPPVSIPPFPAFQEDLEDWHTYERRLKQHFHINKIQSEVDRRSYFLAWNSSSMFQLLAKLIPGEPDELTFTQICTTLQAYYRRRYHVLAARVEFYQCRKKPGQTYRQWAAELHGLCRKCSFQTRTSLESYADDMVRDHLIQASPDIVFRQDALKLDDPTLDQVLDLAFQYEVSTAAGQRLDTWADVAALHAAEPASQAPEGADVAAIGSEPRSSDGRRQPARRPPPRAPRAVAGSAPSGGLRRRRQSQRLPSCPQCYRGHDRTECPDRWAQCDTCGRDGHLAAVCRSKDRPQHTAAPNPRYQPMDINMVQADLPSKLCIPVHINDHPLTLQVDTGAAVSLLSTASYAAVGAPPLRPTPRRLLTYNRQAISILGVFTAAVTYKSVSRDLQFFVVDHPATADLFGLDAFRAFGFTIDDHVNLVSHDVPFTDVAQLCEEFQDLFSPGVGCAKEFQASLTLRPRASPRYCKARPVPLALQPLVAQELDRLQQDGVISPIRFSQWATPVVILHKPSGKLRICGDFKATLNPQLVVDDYPLPKPDELFTKLAGGKFFSKIDLAEAYLQLPLDSTSADLVVIATHIGLFRLNRLMYGIASAPAIFQRYLEQLLKDIPGCINYLDDIVVSGTSAEDHLHNLRTLFTRLRQAGLKCNKAKCAFFQASIHYLGHVISADGITPSEPLVRAIAALPPPTNVTQLRSFLGKVSYYRKFLPHLATTAAPLHALCRKEAPFRWTPACDKAFHTLRQALQEAPCLTNYTPSLPVWVAADASESGLGAVLAHRYPDGSERPIAYASKTLTEAQRKYSQIEKEALAIVFACSKFYPYLYGRHFHILTDHKPLLSLFAPEAPLPKRASHRITRWALFLSRFRFQLHFRSSGKHANADALSRLPCGPDALFDTSELLVFQVDEDIQQALDRFPVTARQVADATARDRVLRPILRFVREGWPDAPPPAASPDLRFFFTIRHQLVAAQGVLLWAAAEASPRVVVPEALQQRTLRILHEGHWGLTRTKTLARRHVFWRGLTADLTRLIHSCDTCARQQARPPLLFQSWPAASAPWERLHVDYAGPFLGSYWLLLTDAYSHFPFIFPCQSITSAFTISALEKVFALEGLPSTLVTDNGPQFRSQEFETFCSRNGVSHVLTPPFHPQSNGAAERLVRTFKTQMLKYTETRSVDQALLLFLSTYRATPVQRQSPAEMLHGRQPKTLLHLLHPPPLVTGQPGGRQRYRPGTLVWARGFGPRPSWVPASVVRNRGRVLYEVHIQGRTVTRHRNQLRLRIPAPSSPVPMPTAPPVTRPLRHISVTATPTVTRHQDGGRPGGQTSLSQPPLRRSQRLADRAAAGPSSQPAPPRQEDEAEPDPGPGYIRLIRRLRLSGEACCVADHAPTAAATSHTANQRGQRNPQERALSEANASKPTVAWQRPNSGAVRKQL